MAQDVFLSAIYLGNFADIDTFEGNLNTENEAAFLGTYGSAADPLADHVVTLESDSPSQYIDTDQDTGNGTLIYDIGSGPTTASLDSMVTYYATITFADQSTTNLVIDLVQMTNGDTFFIAWDNSPVLASQAIESISLNSVEYDDWAGFTQSSYDTTVFVCFAPGTRIGTPDGETPVEALQPGGLVQTADHGAQPLRWIGHRTLRFPGAAAGQKPIEIKPGALGKGLPRRRLILSPQHRVLLQGPQVSKALGRTEALAPAHALTSLRHIRRMQGAKRVTYFSLLFDRHEVIFAEGAAVESLYLGPMAQEALSPFDRLEIRVRLPNPGATRLARPVLQPSLVRSWDSYMPAVETRPATPSASRRSSALRV